MQSDRKNICCFSDTGLQSNNSFYHWVYLVYFYINYFEMQYPLEQHILLFVQLLKDDFMQSDRKNSGSFSDTGLQSNNSFYHWVTWFILKLTILKCSILQNSTFYYLFRYSKTISCSRIETTFVVSQIRVFKVTTHFIIGFTWFILKLKCLKFNQLRQLAGDRRSAPKLTFKQPKEREFFE